MTDKFLVYIFCLLIDTFVAHVVCRTFYLLWRCGAGSPFEKNLDSPKFIPSCPKFVIMQNSCLSVATIKEHRCGAK